MSINIFEGARRLAIVAALIATLVTFTYQFFHEPSVSRSYRIAHPTMPFIRNNDSCPENSYQHYFFATTNRGNRVWISLCILPSTFGKHLIPYKVDDSGTTWTADTFSRQVSEYADGLEKRFRIPNEDQREIDEEASRQYWADVRENLKIYFVGLMIFSGFVYTVGWVVRGFLGIPRGLDRRPSNNDAMSE